MQNEYLTEEQLMKLANEKYIEEYFVYFDKDTGSLLSITNERQPQFETFIEVDFEDVKQFFTGEFNFINYKVALQNDGSIKFVNKAENNLAFKSNIVEYIRPTNKEAMLNVTWNTDHWAFSIHQDFLQNPRAKSLNAKLHFYITLENNINFLIRSVEIQLRNLVGNAQVVVPFETDKETDIENIAMFTLPFFESYGMKINYED